MADVRRYGGIRRIRTEWLTGGLHILIVFIAAHAEDASAWPFALAAMSAVSFFAWIGNFRRFREIDDVPTSKVASAAQGYVELLGRSEPIRDHPVIAPLSQLSCCWYRYSIETKDNENNWSESDHGESVEHFLLVDDTGECVVSPDGADVQYTKKSTWISGDCRYSEWLLVPRATLYALGEFRTVSGNSPVLDENKDTSNLLADWKRDKKTLMDKFDMNRDGTLDLDEWERARRAAREEVRKDHAEIRASGDVHLLCKPHDGRLFLLAGAVPSEIGKRYAFWAWAHLVFFFGAGFAAFLLLVRMFK